MNTAGMRHGRYLVSVTVISNRPPAVHLGCLASASMTIDLSVVVPFHDVAAYAPTTLASLRRNAGPGVELLGRHIELLQEVDRLDVPG